MTTPEHILRNITHKYIRAKDPEPVEVKELYDAIAAEVSFDSDDLTPPILHGEKTNEPSWRRNVRNSLQADKASCTLVNHTKGFWRLPTPLPRETQLDPDFSWRLIEEAAQLALEADQLFTSHKQGKTYRILEVTPTHIEIGRSQEGESARLGAEATKSSIRRFNASGGRAGIRTLNYTVAMEVILVALHPQLGWSEDGDWIQLVQDNNELMGGSPGSWRDEVQRFVISKWNSGETFESDELYAHEAHFKELFPGNYNIKAALRRFLQVLRDEGLVEFLERGKYRVLGGEDGVESATGVSGHRRIDERLPVSDFDPVKAEHVLSAVQKLRSGFVDHRFGPSKFYDLIDSDGTRLPPKAVFGIAASEALGFEVFPEHFNGGEGTICFRVLREAGFKVVPKGDDQDGAYAQMLQNVAKQAEEDGYFDPNPEDERERKLQAIVHRRGQPKFRRKLIEAYAGRCAVTGYDSVRALEAAHIKDYVGPDSNHVKNGLLLRADIHTLFDLGDLAINPETYEVVISDQLFGTKYQSLAGEILSLPEDTSKHPSSEALEDKWSRFKQ